MKYLFLAPIEDTFIGNNEDNRQDTKNLELMSFDPEHPVLSNSISHPDLMDSLKIVSILQSEINAFTSNIFLSRQIRTIVSII